MAIRLSVMYSLFHRGSAECDQDEMQSNIRESCCCRALLAPNFQLEVAAVGGSEESRTSKPSFFHKCY